MSPSFPIFIRQASTFTAFDVGLSIANEEIPSFRRGASSLFRRVFFMGILRELHFEYDWSSSSSPCVHLVKIFRIVAHIPAIHTQKTLIKMALPVAAAALIIFMSKSSRPNYGKKLFRHSRHNFYICTLVEMKL